MKFSAPIALFAAGVLAAPSASELCTRELSTVNTIMTTVLNGIQNLDTTCLSYTGGPGPELTNASTYMLEIIRTATNNAAAMLPLTMEEAQAFQPLSDQLNAAGDKLLTDISSKVALFSAACICDTTLNWVAHIGMFHTSASRNLQATNTINSRKRQHSHDHHLHQVPRRRQGW